MTFAELSAIYANLQAEFLQVVQNNKDLRSDLVHLEKEIAELNKTIASQERTVIELENKVEVLEYDNRKLLDELYREEQEYYKLECLLREVEGRD